MYLPLVTLATIISNALNNTQRALTLDNSLAVNCPCTPGWTGADCNQLQFAPISESPLAYTAGVYDPVYKTWGGNPLQTDTIEFWLGTTLPNPRGLGCWPNDSSCGIWYKDSSGKFVFRSMIGFGDFAGYKYNDVPWCHNFRASIEYKLANISDPNSGRKYALRFDAIFSTSIATRKFQSIVLTPTSGKGCSTSSWVEHFPSTTKDQNFMVAYRELLATNYTAALKEIRLILLNDTVITSVNGYNQSERVNTALVWLDLRTKVANPYVNSVNPQPLIESADNMLAIVPNSTGQFQKILSYRFGKPYAGFESIGILYMPADKFIWEGNVMYKRASEIKQHKNIEDPAFVKVKQCQSERLLFILHDFNQCGSALKQSCGSSMYYELSVNNDALFSNKAKWSTSSFAYDDNIPTLSTKSLARQRPYLSFSNGKPDKLWTGLIWANEQYKGGCLNYPVQVMH